MATYIPNATLTTEPTEDRTVESAALEFRTLKAYAVTVVTQAGGSATAAAGSAEAAANSAEAADTRAAAALASQEAAEAAQSDIQTNWGDKLAAADASAGASAASAVQALASQNASSASAANSQAARIAAEAARDAAFVNAAVYTSIAAAQADGALANGAQYQIVSADGLTMLRYRKDSSIASTLMASYPSSLQVRQTAARVGADRARNERFLNRFDKNSRAIVAGYITNAGVVVLTGSTIGENVTVVTPLIGVTPGETLYLSQFSSNASLVACYDSNLGVTGAATMASTFVVPAGVFYIQFSLIWKAAAYISSHSAAYYDFGYTLDDYQRDFRQTGLAASAHKSSLAAHAGLSNLADSITSSALVDASGVLTINSGAISSANRLVTNRVPVVPGSTIKLTTVAHATGCYIAEYDINGNFLQKIVITNGVNYTVSSNTCYFCIGFSAVDGGVPTATLVYVTQQAVNTKAIDSVHADIADLAVQLTSDKVLKNVSLFATTIATSAPSDLTVDADANGAVFTAITNGNGSAVFNLLNTVLAGEKYQLAIDYEVLELNCTSVQVIAQPFFATAVNYGRVITLEQIGVGNTLTVKSLTAGGTNFTCVLKTIASGSKINAGLAYFAKVRIRRVSIVTYLDAFENVQNIERVLGNVEIGTKYFNSLEAQIYDKFSTAANFQGYNLVRIDHVESTKNFIGKTFEANSSTANADVQINVACPPVLNATAGFAYVDFDVTLNTLNADYFNLVHRGPSGDEKVVLTRADIGKRRVIRMVRKIASFASSYQYLLIGTSRVFTGGVAGVGLDGGSPTVNLTVHNYSQYISQNFFPTSYHADFFTEAHTEDLLTDYVKLPVHQVVINTYGDSITEHNYAKFVAVDGYDFAINIYGLRTLVSDRNGAGTGACNADKYGVMTDAADVVMPMFGTHDWSKPTPVGSIGTLDKTTYIGAYEVLIRGLIAKYPNKIILPVSITPRNLTNTDAEFFNGVTASGITLRDYVNALKALCDHYGLPFVDAFAASGANFLTMTGNPNLYVPGTTTDNTLIDATGVSSTNTGFFTSDFINVTQGKTYGAAGGCFFVEYNGSTFIRRSPAGSVILHMHPSTTRVKLCVSKAETVIDGTTVGVGPGRFWFADQADACMRDRIHPEAACQARIAAEVSRVLKPVLDARRMTAAYQGTIYNNAD